MPKPIFITRLAQVPQLQKLSAAKRERLHTVARHYPFRTNNYYLSLIDWEDPADPIRRIVLPDEVEFEEWGSLDASGEADYAKAPGLEHKYADTALLLVNDVCGSVCRFCFRKRLFHKDNDEVTRDIGEALDYIRSHRDIRNVLLTGGDPLLLSTWRLEQIVAELRDIDHVGIIRIGSKMPAFNPFRILDDPTLLEMLRTYSGPAKRIYLMAHFNHPRELTPEAARALELVQQAGAVVMNQTPLIRGVNDDPAVLAELFEQLAQRGVAPYYVFQCRPTKGNFPYTLPLEEAYQIFLAAQNRCSGLAKRARLAMSHHSGKIEVTGLTEEYILFRYHRAADPADGGRTVICHRNPEGYWFEDFLPADLPTPAPSHQLSRRLQAHRTYSRPDTRALTGTKGSLKPST